MSLGLTTGLRTLAELRQQSVSEKRVIVRIAPTKVISSWTQYTSGVFQAFVEAAYDQTLLPITGMRCGIYPHVLARAETLAECVATEGTFYYDPDIQYVTAQRSWDDGLPWWDDPGSLFDIANRVYVHLPSGVAPETTIVLAEYGLFLSTVGKVISDLGPEKLVNGSFERATAGLPDGWTILTAGGGMVQGLVDQAIATRGSRCLRMVSPGGTPWGWDTTTDGVWDAPGYSFDLGHDPSVWAKQDQQAQLYAGARYVFSGTYQHDLGAESSWKLFVRVGNAVDGYLEADGYSHAGGWIEIPSSGGEVRRWRLEFVAWADMAADVEIRAWNEDAGDAPGGTIRVDAVSLRRSWRDVFADPRLDGASIPTTSQATRDVWFGGQTIGSGDLELIVADGALDRLMAVLDWHGADVEVFSGGAFADGEEIPCEECAPEFAGVIEDLDGNDLRARLTMLDRRQRLDVSLPLRTYTAESTPGIASQWEGRDRPMLFGPKANITPVPIAPAGDYLTYEVADTGGSPAGIKALTSVYAYADSQAASEKAEARRKTLVSGLDYSEDLAGGGLTILRDVQLVEIQADKNQLDFTDDSGTHVAVLTPGLYMPHELVAHVQAAVRAVGDSDHVVTHSDATHKIAWAKGAGTLSLLRSTGDNRDLGAWALLGWESGDDLTGSLSYEADGALFDPLESDAQTKHVIRVDAEGYKDDAQGTFTGTPGALVEHWADQVGLVIGAFLQQPDLIDDVSFDAARALLPAGLGFYLKSETNLRDILDTIELSVGAKLVLDADGLLYCAIPGDPDEPVVELYDQDFLSFSWRVSGRDVCSSVVLEYDEDPSTGGKRSREVENEDVAIRYRKTQPRTFPTFHVDPTYAVPRCSAIAVKAQSAPRLVIVEVKGKLQSRRVGSRVRVTRARASTPTGALDAQEFEVVSLGKAPVVALGTATLVEV